jgi:Ca2+-binding EF-hand superfamily protein
MKNTSTRRTTQIASKVTTKQEARLPDYLVIQTQLEDLRIAFSLYENPEIPEVIQMSQARGILWNFGFWRMTSKEFEKELANNGVDSSKNSIEWGQLVSIVTKRYHQGGREQELKDTFKIFDRREKGSTSVSEIKNSLQSRLEVPISEAEVAEMLEMAGLSNSAIISAEEFMAL